MHIKSFLQTYCAWNFGDSWTSNIFVVWISRTFSSILLASKKSGFSILCFFSWWSFTDLNPVGWKSPLFTTIWMVVTNGSMLKMLKKSSQTNKGYHLRVHSNGQTYPRLFGRNPFCFFFSQSALWRENKNMCNRGDPLPVFPYNRGWWDGQQPNYVGVYNIYIYIYPYYKDSHH